MNRINIHEIKTHLSKYLRLLDEGETIVICRRNVPIAEIRPIATPKKNKRVIGLARGEFTVPGEFFEPLPDDIVAGFEGG